MNKKVPRTKATPPVTRIVVTPAFKLVFLSVLGLTIALVIASICLAVFPTQTEAVKNVTGMCMTLCKSGFGAILGLLGGKVL